MKSAKISYLRDHLSNILQQVQEGEPFLILERNTPVARLEPIGNSASGVSAARTGLARRGVLRPASKPLVPAALRRLPVALPEPGADVIAALLADREESQ